jgi:thiopeptide-type bacteriocin biosynthesis protein
VFDAYDPEVERYGGPNGIHLCERIFGIDSRFTMEMLARYMAPEDAAPEHRIRGVENRWLLTALSVGTLLRGFGLDAAQQLAFVEPYASSLQTEMPGGVPQQKMLGTLYRQYRGQLETALTGDDPREWFAPALHEFLADRTRTMNETMTELNRRADAGELATRLDDIRTSLLHMHCNRMFISQQRRQEFVLLQLLQRAMKGIAGRQRNLPADRKVAQA